MLMSRNQFFILFAVGLFVSCGILSADDRLRFVGARQDYVAWGPPDLGDFNGDGFLDIVTSNGLKGQKVVIRLNDRKGRFTDAGSITGNIAGNFAAGDFNNDGLLDVAYESVGYLGIALGTGDGGLNPVTEKYWPIYSVRAADFDGDGNLDVAATSSDLLYIFRGNGDGTVDLAASYPASYPAITIADVDDDGRPDILATAPGAFLFYRNIGAGQLASPRRTAFPGGYTPVTLAAADIDGDGSQDVVAGSPTDSITNANSNGSTPGGYVATFRGDGQGGFETVNGMPTTLRVYAVALEDADQDSLPELFFGQDFGSVRYVGTPRPRTNLFACPGHGNFEWQDCKGYATTGAFTRILVADLRGTGKQDLLAHTSVGGGVYSILPATSPGEFWDNLWFPVDEALQNAASGDFNHDGLIDLAIAKGDSQSPEGRPGVYIFLGTGDPRSPFAQPSVLEVASDIRDIKTADFNHDGNLDLVFLADSDLAVSLGNGVGEFSPDIHRYSSGGYSLALTDFNSDGKLDVVTSGVFLHAGNGDGTFGEGVKLLTGGLFVGAADLNKDGKSDLLVGLPADAPYDFYVTFGNGDGTFAPGRSYGVLNGRPGISSAAFADFNGDGFLDVTVLDSDAYVYLNTGDGTLDEVGELGYLAGNQARQNSTIAVADFNLDGHLDIAIPNEGVRIYLGDGTGMKFTTERLQLGTALYPSTLVVDSFQDFGAAHAPDIVAIGPNGAISVLINKGGCQESCAPAFY